MTTTINASTSAGLISSGDTSGVLALQTNSGTTAVTIDTSQNVGIGTTSPTAKLDVSSSSAGVTAGDLVVDTANKTVYVGRQSSTGGDNSYLVVRGRVNGSGTNQAIAITGDTSAYGTGLFRPNNDTLGFSTLATERMRIDSSGNLLVGTTTSTGNTGKFQSKNTTAGPAGYFETNAPGGSQNVIDITNAANAGMQAVRFFVNGYGVTQVGSISCTTSNTAYNTSSDYRLKNSIAPMTGALDKVSQLKPVTYKWNIDNSDGQGFIAHELQEVVPDCVTGEKDAVDADGKPVYQGIDVSFLVATLTAAIQELKAINDTQAETINALTARIVALEAK
jgi:Chaperone of endosialidase